MNYLNWIFVPVDYSTDSRLALEMADRQAAQWGAGLILLHVISFELPELSQTTTGGALGSWFRYVKRVPENRVAFITCEGDPAERILQLANQYRVRAIFIGKGGFGRRMGQTAREVVPEFKGEVEIFASNFDRVGQRAI
jgi:hypothetical protein